MPRNGKPENLIPMNKRTKEEQTKIARKGGKASGVSRRKKRDAKSAAQLILNLPTMESIEKNLKAMGVEEEDFTNLVALMARAFEKAISTGDINAMRFIVEMANITPAQKFAEKQYRDKQKKPISEKDEAIQKLEEVLEGIKSGF